MARRAGSGGESSTKLVEKLFTYEMDQGRRIATRTARSNLKSSGASGPAGAVFGGGLMYSRCCLPSLSICHLFVVVVYESTCAGEISEARSGVVMVCTYW